MIKNVLILNNNGRVLVTRVYDELLSFERRLIGGFLLAMTQFSQETFSDPVREIHFSKMRILLKRNEGFCIAGIVDLHDDIEMINDILKGISKKLSRWYKDTISINDVPSQHKISHIEHLIDDFVLPFRSFDLKIPEFMSKPIQSTSSSRHKELNVAFSEKQKRFQKVKRFRIRKNLFSHICSQLLKKIL